MKWRCQDHPHAFSCLRTTVVSTHSKTSPTILKKFTRMKSITYIYAQFTKRELYPVAWASNRGLHPVIWALRKNVDSVLLFGFQNIRKKFGQCFVIWVSKHQLTDCTGIFLKEIYQPVFGTSEGYVDSILDFRRMCRWYFGLQKDVQTVFWT